MGQWRPVYLPFQTSWPKVIRPSTSFPPPRLIMPCAGFSLNTAGSQPPRSVPFRSHSRLRLTRSLRSIQSWLWVQKSRFAAVPTGPWLSAVYHVMESYIAPGYSMPSLGGMPAYKKMLKRLSIPQMTQAIGSTFRQDECFIRRCKFEGSPPGWWQIGGRWSAASRH